MEIKTCEMHSGGEPFRIVESGYPEIRGRNIMKKRDHISKNLDHARKMLMWEPRGHNDMYGAVLVPPDDDAADIAVVFIHNDGYSTMCGHGVIALARYAVDKGLVKNVTSPETKVNIQCPCGVVECHVQFCQGDSGSTRFTSVPAFVFATEVEVELRGFGTCKVDIVYGGAYYVIISAEAFEMDVRKSKIRELRNLADFVTDAVKKKVEITHPDSSDLAFLFGTIITDGTDSFSDDPTANVCFFADRQMDRSPCGSGVTARIALQYHNGLIQLGQTRQFESAVTGSIFTGKPIKEVKCGSFKAITVEVSGKGWYCGNSTFTIEEGDNLGKGFLIK